MCKGRERVTYGVVNVRANDETFGLAVGAVLDSDNVSGLSRTGAYSQ